MSIALQVALVMVTILVVLLVIGAPIGVAIGMSSAVSMICMIPADVSFATSAQRIQHCIELSNKLSYCRVQEKWNLSQMLNMNFQRLTKRK